jgi:hypothetical protein
VAEAISAGPIWQGISSVRAVEISVDKSVAALKEGQKQVHKFRYIKGLLIKNAYGLNNLPPILDFFLTDGGSGERHASKLEFCTCITLRRDIPKR